MLPTARKLLALFDARERRRLAGVMAAVIATGLLQMVGVGSVVPFISLVSDRSLAQENAFLAWLYGALGFTSTDSFLIVVGLCVLVLLVVGNAFVALTIWLIARFAWENQRRLSVRLLVGYLGQPYEAFLNRNSADIGKNILIESQQFTQGVLMPAMYAVAFGITVLFLAILLLVVDPLLALLVAAVFGLAYLAVYLFVRRPLVRIGLRRITANTERFKAVDQAFGSVKEVKVLGREADFVGQYRPAAGTFADSMSIQLVLGQVPRYAIEALAFSFVIGLFLYLLGTRASLQSVLPLAGAFALAGYRMLPALQQVFQSVSALRFNQAVLDTIHSDLVKHADSDRLPARPAPLPFVRELRLEGISYFYPGAQAPAVDSVSLTIPRNSFVAFVGATGSGKTTLADVILGLLAPQTGEITVDGVPIGENNRRAWQAIIGYVPQDIYLIDDTVVANIAYGVPAEERDAAAVERAGRIANIHDFITESLPYGYETVVGERGVRLSGGQRQRIGIARALYHDPQVLVLDEATSALDNETERRIVEELDAMRGGRTLIVIAHRLSTVRRCKRLHLLEAGRLAASGSYEDLTATSTDFRRLTRVEAAG